LHLHFGHALEESMSSRSGERSAVAWLFGGCGLLIAAGLGLHTVDAVTAPAALRLGDASEAQIVEIRDHRGVTLMSGEFRSRVDSLGNTEKDAALMDRQGRRVLGEVEIEIPATGRDDRQPELEVDIIGLPPRGTFTLTIDDRAVGTFSSDDRGSIDMELQEGEIAPP
jgi:hypothetical protein